MAAIVSFLNSKGGTSKSTTAISVARELQKRGNEVLLIDSDPQGTSMDWSASTQGEYFSVISIDRPVLEAEISKLSSRYDWIIIDGAAKLEKMLVSALKASDLVIIPVRPSQADVWPAIDLVEMIKTRQQITEGSPAAAFLITQAVKGTLLEVDVINACKTLEMPVFKTVIHFKQAYAKAISTGKTALEIDGSARVEINNLVDEIEGAFK